MAKDKGNKVATYGQRKGGAAMTGVTTAQARELARQNRLHSVRRVRGL